MKMAFCLRAITTLGDADLSSLTDKVEAYTQAGMDATAAEMAAVDDMLAEVRRERDELQDVVRAQYPELFGAPAPSRPPSGNTIFTDDAAAAARARLLKNRGRLSSGIDPQDMLDGITLAGYHIERGARKFSAFARAMIDDLGDWVKPYLKSWYMATKYGPHAASFEGMSAAQEVETADIENLESADASNRQPGVEPDRTPGQKPQVAPADGDGLRGPDGRDGAVGGNAAGRGGRVGGDPGLRAGGPAAAGAASDQGLPEEKPAVPDGPAGSADAERGDLVDDPGAQPDRFTDESVEDTSRASTTALIDRTRQQRDAEKIKVEPGLANIAATLPVLLPLQQKDVEFVEKRFAVDDGYGVLLTNAAGTGKTFIGLGAIKRQVMQGKKNILIAAPSQEVINGWLKSAPMVGVSLTQLASTKDAGSGVVITTYANLRDNNALATRQWDMVVSDEAQALNQNAEGEPTEAARRFRALTLHPDAARTRTRMLHPELAAEMDDLAEKMKAAAAQKNKVEQRVIQAKQEPLYRRFLKLMEGVQESINAAQGAGRTRALFLSATPFAYETSVKWAQGYLFDWNKGFNQTDGYNAPDAYQSFMISNFGWHMKTGKLNQPDERKVNRGLMQRQFNTRLKTGGVLAGRVLGVEPDYDRRFVAAQSGLGRRIDQAFAWFWDTQAADLGLAKPAEFEGDDKQWDGAVRNAMGRVRQAMTGRFDYHTRMRLLESLKAEAAVPYITKQMALGRKVVVFHDLIQGQTHDPFNLQFDVEKYPLEAQVFDKWKAPFADLVERNWNMLKSPIETLTESFPGLGVLNGKQSGKARAATMTRFNSDDQGPMVMVVQAALEAGWSGHDTTGKYPRVLINLGLPVTPTRSIQQEGRIYRVGQASNAMFRYFNTQTNWEFDAFANTIAKRASTAENLAMGEDARGLLASYVESFEQTEDWAPGHEGEGTGGKARDRELSAVLSDWDKAKTMYWAKLKKTTATKAREGKDWFATPEPLGMKMVEWADLRPGETSMEPSAGDGAIARWLPDFTKRIAVEPSPSLAPRLALVFDGSMRQHPFEDLHVTNKADGIVMNPPFGKGGSLAGPHLDKAFNQHLDEGGRLVALIPEGPAMEARLDKFLNGTKLAPLKPLATIPGIGEVYAGDIMSINVQSAGMPGGNTSPVRLVVGHAAEKDGVWHVWPKGERESSALVVRRNLGDAVIRSDGARATEKPNSEGAHLVATIRLPADTFGRAGTKVATRIVIIDKLAKDQAAPERVDHDFSKLGSVEELFDAIEHLTIPERTKPRPAELDDEGAAQSSSDGLSDIPGEKDKPAPKRDIKDERAKVGIELAKQFGLPVVEHTTKNLNLLHGVILKHVTLDQAREFDKVAWAKNGGVFVRVWELNDLLKKYPLPLPVLSAIGGPAIPGGIKAVDLRKAVRAATEHWDAGASAPKVRVVATATDLPGDVQMMLTEMNALLTTRGLMMPDGRVFLVADRINNAPEGQAILFHETYGHFGLRAFLGDSYTIQMGLLRMANPKLAAEANTWYAAFSQHQINARVMAGMGRAEAEAAVRGLAVEEALADRAGANEPPKGWKLLMARLQKALRALGLDGVADMLERMTEAETHALLISARQLVTGDQAHANTMSPALGGATDRAGRLAQEGRPAQDLSRVGDKIASQGYEKETVKHLMAANRLQAILADKAAGKLTPEEFAAAVASLADQMADVSATKQANRLMTERQRGADILREKLIRARRRGDMGEEAVGFGLWLIDKNPSIASDLSISILSPKDGSPAGSYNPATRVIKLFKENGNADTVAHEILHHAERMMPPELQGPIRGEWAKALAAGLMAAQSQPKVLAALQDILLAAAGSSEAHQRTLKALQNGVLSYDQHYQLFNASEFWAVNGARILSNRYLAKDSVWLKIRDWLRDMWQYLRGALGLRSDAPVLRALANVTNPENFGVERGGDYSSEEMLNKGDDERQSLGSADPSIVLSQTAAPAPAAPARLKPSSAPIDAGLRILSAPVAKVTSRGYTMATHYADLALGAGIPGNAWEYVKAGMVDQYGLNPEHAEAKTQMRTAIRVNARKTGEIVDKLRALSADESRIAYLWMSDKSADSTAERALFDQLPEESRAILESLKADIEYLSNEAVDLGLLSKEVRDRHAMAYMHRSYEKYEAGEVGARVARTRAISILGDQFKGRGMRANAGMEQIGSPDFWARKTRDGAHDPSLKGQRFTRLERRETPDSNTPQLFKDEDGKPMGLIREIAYWPAGEPIPAKLNDWRNAGQWEARFFDKSGKVGMWRDFTLAERTELGEVQEVKYATAITMMQMVRDVETARFLDWVARNESVLDPAQFPEGAIEVEGASFNLTRSYLKNEWVQVPQTKVPGTGVHKYANLAGRWVPGPVWNDIRQISELTDQGDLMKVYSGMMRAWKISKTALSPVTHMNNVMSNFMLADIHDIQARHIYTALNAWLRKGSDPALRKLIEDYQDNGGDAGKFNEAEVREELFGPLLAELKKQIKAESGVSASVTAAQIIDLLQHRQFRQAFAATGNSMVGEVAKWVPKKMMKLYGVEDEVFRLAAFIKAREDGLSDHDSGRFARESFLNYEITAPWVNAMRRTAWPFFAFTYRALPMLAKSFAEKPHKLLKYFLLAGALDMAAYGMLGGGGDEDKERALMPKEKAGKVWGFLTPKLVRMFWNDKNDDPVFLDIRRWVPGGDFADVGQSNSAIPLPPPLMPGGPLMLMANLVMNHDGFTDQPIRNQDTRWSNPEEAVEALGDTADWLWKAVMPNNPAVPWTYSQEGLIKAARGDVVAGKGGQEKASLAQAALSTFGVKVGSYPIDALAHNTKSKLNAEVRRIEGDAHKEIGRLGRTGKSDADKEDAEAKIKQAALAKIRDRVTEAKEDLQAAGR